MLVNSISVIFWPLKTTCSDSATEQAQSNQKKDFNNKRVVLSPMNERIITKTYLNNT